MDLIPSLRWSHNEHDSVPNHQRLDCLLNHLCKCRSKKTSKFRVTGLCAGNSPGDRWIPAQMASNAGNVSIWLRHRAKARDYCFQTSCPVTQIFRRGLLFANQNLNPYKHLSHKNQETPGCVTANRQLIVTRRLKKYLLQNLYDHS